MGDTPTLGQLVLLALAAAAFAIGGIASFARGRFDRRDAAASGAGSARAERARVVSKISLYVGSLLCVGVLVWHDRARGAWMPLEDNFGAFVWLALLLALFVAYTQRAHPLRGLEGFILPIVALLLVLAAVFGKAKPHAYRETTWNTVHLLSAFGGFLAFAVGGAVGAMYLIVNRRLRSKRMIPGQGFGSLERLERLTFVSVTLGFALLTIGLVTGLVRVLDPHGAGNSMGHNWYRNPKVLLAFGAWLVYALVLHSPINPAFRGKRTAWLSVVGLGLMVGTLVAVQYMPTR